MIERPRYRVLSAELLPEILSYCDLYSVDLWASRTETARVAKPSREPDDVRVRFGSRVRSLRNERGLSQEDFADLCNLDRTYISGIERGIRNPALRNIEAIARALDVPLGVLFEPV